MTRIHPNWLDQDYWDRIAWIVAELDRYEAAAKARKAERAA